MTGRADTPEAVFVDDLLTFAAREFRESRRLMDQRRGQDAEDHRKGAVCVIEAVAFATKADPDALYDRVWGLVKGKG